MLKLLPVHAAPLWISEAATAVAAGFPSPAYDYLEPPIDLAEKLMPRPASTILIRAAGWSMRGAGISDGDLLVVERGRTPQDGQIVIAVVDGEFVMKTLRSKGRHPRLAAANPDFPDIPLAGRDVTMWGVVCWVLHRTI